VSLKLKNIFGGDEEARIVKHMNDDHVGNLKDYVRFYLKQAVGEGDLVRMCGMDQYGVDLAVNEVKERVLFPEVIGSSGDVRGVFVEMAKASKA
jgi:putative heme iron utilization protein